MNDIIITDESNNRFKIVNRDGKYDVYKLENNVPVNATAKEVEFVINEIKRLQTKNIISDEKKHYEDFLKMLNDMIRSGEIKNSQDLKKFIDQCDLTEEEKNNLLQEGLSSLNITEIVDLKNEIIDCIRKDKRDNLEAIISFNVKDDAIGSRYCDVRFAFKDDKQITEPVHKNLPYSEVLKTELIEPVLLEVSLRSKVQGSYAKRNDDIVNDRGDYYLKTEEKISVGVRNVEFDYANKLGERMDRLKDQTEKEDEVRDEKIDELQNEEKRGLNEQQNQNYRYDPEGNVYDEQGNYIGRIENGEIKKEHDELQKDKPVSLVREKKEQTSSNGFSLTIIVFAVTSFITSLLLLFQALCFLG